jgi:hypothetical protein
MGVLPRFARTGNAPDEHQLDQHDDINEEPRRDLGGHLDSGAPGIPATGRG